jgi:hypothetical protein
VSKQPVKYATMGPCGTLINCMGEECWGEEGVKIEGKRYGEKGRKKA